MQAMLPAKIPPATLCMHVLICKMTTPIVEPAETIAKREGALLVNAIILTLNAALEPRQELLPTPNGIQNLKLAIAGQARVQIA